MVLARVIWKFGSHTFLTELTEKKQASFDKTKTQSHLLPIKQMINLSMNIYVVLYSVISYSSSASCFCCLLQSRWCWRCYRRGALLYKRMQDGVQFF